MRSAFRFLLVGVAALPLGSARAQSMTDPAGSITYFDSGTVATAFAKGKPLLEAAAYKIHASRRETPGQAEVHTRDTDIIYVLQGHAVFITGGAAKDLRTVAPAAASPVDSRAAGPDLQPTGAPTRAYDISPHAGAADFDDSGWPVIAPTTLEARRTSGRLAFGWYRLKVTIPDRLAKFDPTGSTAIFEIVVDDYAEIWANGQLPLVLGQTGGHVIKGWNTPNRVVLGRDVRPGQQFQLAVFATNGPLSDPPANYVWIRSAPLSFYKPDQACGVQPVMDEIVRLNPALDDIVPGDAKIEKIAGGFQFTEGPIWIRDGGYLLFSDPNANAIYRWTPDGQVSVFRTKSGYTGADIGEYNQPGSNGLTLDRDGRLTIDEHGNRRVTRLEKNGVLTVLAEQYEGKRLNSPNDLVYRSDGALYFTDPPFGLPKFYDDPRKELPFSGIFLLKDGHLNVVSTHLLGPNGLAFSPDEKYLYVDNWDEKKKAIT